MADAAFSALTTERLVLRRFRPEDLDAFVACRSDPQIARYQVWEAPYLALAPEHQGHGYATEAVRRLLHYLLVERGKHRVSAACDDRNTRSAAVLERVGMRREGHLLESTWSKGEWSNDLLYAPSCVANGPPADSHWFGLAQRPPGAGSFVPGGQDAVEAFRSAGQPRPGPANGR